MVNRKKDSHPVLKEELSLSQKASDKLTKIVGSWNFLIYLGLFLAVWMTFNAQKNSWDPYPFILLNFVLSCLAAIQSPIILMSQNRQTEKDRLAAKYDYQVNVAAEAEIEDMQEDLEILKRQINLLKSEMQDTKSILLDMKK